LADRFKPVKACLPCGEQAERLCGNLQESQEKVDRFIPVKIPCCMKLQKKPVSI
jgi:hypothetical protein